MTDTAAAPAPAAAATDGASTAPAPVAAPTTVAAPPAPTAEVTAALGATPAQQPQWAWPDDIKVAAHAKGWDKMGGPADALPEIARSYLRAEKLIGAPQDTFLRLTDDPSTMTDKQRERLATFLGRPEKASDYKIVKPDNLPADYPYDDGLIGSRLEKFHQLGLSNATVQALHDELHQANITAMQSHSAEMKRRAEEGDAFLRKAWGGQYETNNALAERVIAQHGGQEFADWLKEYGFDRAPAFRSMLASVGRAMGEHGTTVSSGSTVARAKAEVERLTADPAFQKRMFGHDGPAAQEAAREVWKDANRRLAEEASR